MSYRQDHCNRAVPNNYHPVLHEQGRPIRVQGSRPDWVSAASLHAALQASRVVPLMHAAAVKERRLVMTSAVARQQLELGLTAKPLCAAPGTLRPPEAVLKLSEQKGHGSGVSMQGTDANHAHSSVPGADVDRVVQLTHQLAEQNMTFQQALHQQSQQLKKQEVRGMAVWTTSSGTCLMSVWKCGVLSAVNDDAVLPAVLTCNSAV